MRRARLVCSHGCRLYMPLSTLCADCAAYRREYYRSYNAEHRDYTHYHAQHRDARLATQRRHYLKVGWTTLKLWRSRNPDKVREARKREQLKHAARYARYKVERKAHVKRATPAWANKFLIEEAYALAALRTRMLGYPWHVDHVIPLRGKDVCGLHVETNLAVVPAIVNLRKGNRRVDCAGSQVG